MWTFPGDVYGWAAVLGYSYTWQIRNEKKEKFSSLLVPSFQCTEKRERSLLFVHWKAGAGFNSVASLVSRPRFIKRITWHSWETGLWMLLFSVGFGLSQPSGLEKTQPQICSVLFGVLLWQQQIVECGQSNAQLQALCVPFQVSWLLLFAVFPSPCCNWNVLVFWFSLLCDF